MSENNPGRAELSIGRERFEGWTTVSVTHSIEQAASSFDLSLTDRWAANQEPRQVRPGDASSLLLEGVPLIKGWIDSARPRYSATSRALQVTGRALTCDLVDCSIPVDGGQYRGLSLVKLARTLCQPFGIEVVNQVGDAEQPLSSDWQIEPGESAFESLERAARFARCLLTCDPAGRLVITRAGTAVLPVHLRLGENILEAEADYDHRDRFSEYAVLGDTASGGDADDWDGEATTQQKGTARDPDIHRYRPLTLLGEDNLDSYKAGLRADWEMRRRRARACRVEITVAGWRMPGSQQLWPINQQVPVTCPWLGNALLLITSVNFTLNQDGTRTRLSLMPREGFDTEPVPPKSNSKTTEGASW